VCRGPTFAALNQSAHPDLDMSGAETFIGNAPRLSLVVPAFNEASRLVRCMEKLNRAARSGAVDPNCTEVIVVDDGSTDATARLAKEVLEPSFPLLHILRLHENSGKGAAIRAGTALAMAPLIAFMDVDMSVDPVQLPQLLASVNAAGIAIGSRSLSSSIVECNSQRRIVMGRTFNWLVCALTNVRLADTQCGFKAFRTPVARILFHLMVMDGFAFDVEVLYLARHLGIHIAEVPVNWRDETGSKVRPLIDPVSMALDVLRMRVARKWPEIPALHIAPGSAHFHLTKPERMDRLLEAVSVRVPIIQRGHNRISVLFPLCDPAELRAVARRVDQLAPGMRVSEQPMSFDELRTLAPLRFLSGRNADVNDADSSAYPSSVDEPSFPPPHIPPRVLLRSLGLVGPEQCS